MENTMDNYYAGRRPAFLPTALAPFIRDLEVRSDNRITLRLAAPLMVSLTIDGRDPERVLLVRRGPLLPWSTIAHPAAFTMVAFGQSPAETLLRTGLSHLTKLPDLDADEHACAHAIAKLATGEWRSIADARSPELGRDARVGALTAFSVLAMMHERAAVVDGAGTAKRRQASWRPSTAGESLQLLDQDLLDGRWACIGMPGVEALAAMYELEPAAVQGLLDELMAKGWISRSGTLVADSGGPEEPAAVAAVADPPRAPSLASLILDRARSHPRLGNRARGVIPSGRSRFALTLAQPEALVHVAIETGGLTSGVVMHVSSGERWLNVFRAGVTAALDDEETVDAALDAVVLLVGGPTSAPLLELERVPALRTPFPYAGFAALAPFCERVVLDGETVVLDLTAPRVRVQARRDGRANVDVEVRPVDPAANVDGVEVGSYAYRNPHGGRWAPATGETLVRQALWHLPEIEVACDRCRVRLEAIASIARGFWTTIHDGDAASLSLAPALPEVCEATLAEMRRVADEVDGAQTGRRSVGVPRPRATHAAAQALWADVAGGRWPAHALLPGNEVLGVLYRLHPEDVAGLRWRLLDHGLVRSAEGGGVRVAGGVPDADAAVGSAFAGAVDGGLAVEVLGRAAVRFTAPGRPAVTVAAHDLGLTAGVGLFADAGPSHRMFVFLAGLPADLGNDWVRQEVLALARTLIERAS